MSERMVAQHACDQDSTDVVEGVACEGEQIEVDSASKAVSNAGGQAEMDADEDEFAEEDAWLRAGHFLDDDEDDDAERYVPQLMDAQEMRELRASLRRGEAQIAMCGRLREFVPRKPVASASTDRGVALMGSKRYAAIRSQQRRGGGDSVTVNMDQRNPAASPFSSGPTRAFLTAAPSTTVLQSPSASQRKEDFSVVLRREMHQLRGAVDRSPAHSPRNSRAGCSTLCVPLSLFSDLEIRYDEVKRMLLEQMDVVCSLKPSERIGGPETYEKLAELMAFIVQFKTPGQDS